MFDPAIFERHEGDNHRAPARLDHGGYRFEQRVQLFPLPIRRDAQRHERLRRGMKLAGTRDSLLDQFGQLTGGMNGPPPHDCSGYSSAPPFLAELKNQIGEFPFRYLVDDGSRSLPLLFLA